MENTVMVPGEGPGLQLVRGMPTVQECREVLRVLQAQKLWLHDLCPDLASPCIVHWAPASPWS